MPRILILTLIVIFHLGTFHAQSDERCSDEFVEAQLALMVAEDYEPDGVDEDELETHAKQHIKRYCDEDREPLMLDDTGIPLETWVVFNDDSGLFENEADEFDVDTSCFYGFLYTDYEMGISMQVHAFCKMSDEGVIVPTIHVVEEERIMIVTRYDSFINIEMTELTPDQLFNLELPIIPDWLSFYNTEELIYLRDLRELDPLRAPGYPDDIEILLIPDDPDVNLELMWGRLVQQLDTPETFEVIVLNQPFYDMGIDSGDHVAVELLEYEGELYAVITGELDD